MSPSNHPLIMSTIPSQRPMSALSIVLNILWFIVGGGVVSALLWVLAGCLLAITVVGLPFAFAAFRIAVFSAFPFGRELVDARVVGEERIPGTMLMNILWFVLAGLWLAIFHVSAAITCFIGIITIPFGFAHFRLAGVCLAPLGKRAVNL